MSITCYEIRDNGGETFDRYCAGFMTGDGEVYGLLIGETGNVPNGVCMHTDTPPSGDFDGDEVVYDDLPVAVQKAIDGEIALHYRLTGEDERDGYGPGEIFATDSPGPSFAPSN